MLIQILIPRRMVAVTVSPLPLHPCGAGIGPWKQVVAFHAPVLPPHHLWAVPSESFLMVRRLRGVHVVFEM